MANGVISKYIDSGPNTGYWYVQTIAAIFDIDTNTNKDFWDPASSFYIQHLSEIDDLHDKVKIHEETRHALGSTRMAEEEMAPNMPCEIENDIFDQCEGIVSKISEYDLQASCANTMQNAIDALVERVIYYEDITDADCPTCVIITNF